MIDQEANEGLEYVKGGLEFFTSRLDEFVDYLFVTLKPVRKIG